jgi:hypothetical protein
MFVTRNLEKSHVFFHVLENQIDSMVPFFMWITLPSGWTVNVPRSVQTFENILLALSLAYVKYYSRDFTFALHFPYLIVLEDSQVIMIVVKITYNTWNNKQSDKCLRNQSKLWN